MLNFLADVVSGATYGAIIGGLVDTAIIAASGPAAPLTAVAVVATTLTGAEIGGLVGGGIGAVDHIVNH